jgi:hypothetical protein
MQTLYRVIGFGTNGHGFFNHFGGCTDSIGYAKGFYKALEGDPEMTGVVLIKSQHEDWQIIGQCGLDGYRVTFGPVGNYKVVPLAQANHGWLSNVTSCAFDRLHKTSVRIDDERWTNAHVLNRQRINALRRA